MAATQNTAQLTIFYVGATTEEAAEGLAFDSFESANSYREDENGGSISAEENCVSVFSASAIVDLNSLTEVI